MRMLKNSEMNGFSGKYQKWLPKKQWIARMRMLEKRKKQYPEPAWEAIKK